MITFPGMPIALANAEPSNFNLGQLTLQYPVEISVRDMAASSHSKPVTAEWCLQRGLRKGKTTTQAEDWWGESLRNSLGTPVKVSEQEGELVVPEESDAFIISSYQNTF